MKSVKKKHLAKKAAIILTMAALLISMLIYVFINFDTQKTLLGEGVQVYFVDVGQGDASLIRIPEENGEYFDILIDSGRHDDKEDIDYFLKSLNIDDLEIAVASHPHADHIGAMDLVIENYDVEKLYMPEIPPDMTPTSKTFESMIEALENSQTDLFFAKSGDSLVFNEKFELEVLAPTKKEYDNLNDYSLVIKFSYVNTDFLFTGDSEIVAQEDALSNNMDFTADVLKVSHHGSSDALNENILSSINPEYAVISCSEDNTYGHPHDETLALLNNIECKIYKTFENGNILFETDGENIEILTQK